MAKVSGQAQVYDQARVSGEAGGGARIAGFSLLAGKNFVESEVLFRFEEWASQVGKPAQPYFARITSEEASCGVKGLILSGGKDYLFLSERTLQEGQKIEKAGLLSKLNSLGEPPEEEETIFNCLVLFLKVPNKKISSFSELLDLSQSSFSGEEKKDREEENYRWKDRLAQRDPDWAISENPEEYERGKRIAPLLGDCLSFLEKVEGKMFLHGRDGEILKDLLERKGKKVSYGLTSRPMTTNSPSPEAILPYLRRVCPQKAVHIDTGFAGSIPRWMARNGFEVESIFMVSANNPEEEIPHHEQNVREVVLTDLEHSAQRLGICHKWGELHYSPACGGYWARLYGVCDALSLPRTLRKEKK